MDSGHINTQEHFLFLSLNIPEGLVFAVTYMYFLHIQHLYAVLVFECAIQCLSLSLFLFHDMTAKVSVLIAQS